MLKKYLKRCAALGLVSALSLSMLNGCAAIVYYEFAPTAEEHVESSFDSVRLERGYKESDFTQGDVDSDTIWWMCSAYAIYTEYNGKEHRYVGGITQADRRYYASAVQEALSDGWGITGREDVESTLNFLLAEGGHRKSYRELVEQMKEDGLMDLSENEAKVQFPQEERERYEAAYTAYQKLGEKAIDGWDYSRALQVLGDCYQCGYISLEECLDLSLPVAREYQAAYDNWDEAAMSYLYGYQFWQSGQESYDEYEIEARWNVYEELKDMENGPYSVPYDTELENTWENADEKKAGAEEEGYEILQNGELARVKIKIPEGFEASTYSDADARSYRKERQDDLYGETTFLYHLRDNTSDSIELEEENAKRAIQVREDNPENENVESSGPNERQVGDLTVHYYTYSYSFDTITIRYYDAWAELDNTNLVVCEVKESVSGGELQDTGDGAILDTAFADIKSAR